MTGEVLARRGLLGARSWISETAVDALALERGETERLFQPDPFLGLGTHAADTAATLWRYAESDEVTWTRGTSRA